MATAKIETVKKTVEKEISEEVVTLTLTREEANVLYSLGAFVAGDVYTTYNKHVRAVRGALFNKGVTSYWGDYFSRGTTGGGITAKPIPNN